MAPGPGIPEEDVRYNVERCGLWAAVVCSNSEQQFVWVVCLLRGLDEAVKVAVIVEDAGIDNVVLLLKPVALRVFFDKVLVWKLALRQLVEKLHVRVLVPC